MLSDEIKKLENEKNQLSQENNKLAFEVASLKLQLSACHKMLTSLRPVKIYGSKSRRNTTVKFEAGNQVTVKRREGEKNCIETAVAYACLKRIIPNSKLKKLIAEAEIHE